MPLIRRPLAFAAVLSLGFALAPAARAGSTPTQPPPPAAGFGADHAEVAVDVGSLENPVAKKHRVWWFRPTTVRPDSKPLPVVVFLHGFGARGPGQYASWLEHIAQGGAVVIFPVYPGFEPTEGASRYDTMWAGVEAALRSPGLVGEGKPKLDLSRFGVAGHSYGGGATGAIAARAWARGYGDAGLFVAAFAPWYDLDREAWKHLPAHAALLVTMYEDDQICDPGIGAEFPALATAVPPERKAVRVFRSDDHGTPALVADHMAPLTGEGADVLDTRGSWRELDALKAFAFEGSEAGRAVALGDGKDALDLGTWSDGTPVRRCLPAWAPDPMHEAKLRWKCGGPGEGAMRRLLAAETYSTLPLPPPGDDGSLARRLPESGRFVAKPPEPAKEGWPASVRSALAKGPVLAVTGDEAIAGEDRLASKGIAVVRLSADDKDAQALRDALSPSKEPVRALLLGRDGRPLLYEPAADPNLAVVAAALAVPPTSLPPSPK